MSAEKSEKWSDTQKRFILWLALPKAMRVPKTQGLLANDLGVHQDTLSQWKNIPGFRDEVTAAAREYMRDDVPIVLDTIRKLAIKGSVAHLNMFLSMTGLAGDVEAAGKGPSEVKAYTIVSPDEWPTAK